MDLSSLSSKLLPGFTTLGFKDERRGKGECGVGSKGMGSGSHSRGADPESSRDLPGSSDFSTVSGFWL